MSMQVRFPGLVLLFVMAVAGCSKGERLKTVAVTGTVTFKGQPLSGALVTFVTSDATGKPANGKTDDQGKYKLSTVVSPVLTQDGALPGEYQVSISKKPPVPESLQNLSPDKIAGMSMEEKAKLGTGGYSRPTSGTVPVQAPTDTPKSEIPERYAVPTTSGLKASVKPGANATDPITVPNFDLTE